MGLPPPSSFGVPSRLSLTRPMREQLHHLSGVVFVRHPARYRIFLGVALGVQIQAHCRVERHGLQELAKIAEGIGIQQIPISGRSNVRQGIVQTDDGNDEELGKREGDALADRVRQHDDLVGDGEIEVDAPS